RAFYNMESPEFTAFTQVDGINTNNKACPYTFLIKKYDTFRLKHPSSNPAIFFHFLKELKSYNVIPKKSLKKIESSQLYKDSLAPQKKYQ
ncbi:MAG TPA: hypothetical protein VEK38_00920, partial [Candidatus Bathyarchaeia archaeon]|nr:hypothetical protein [Candidatus Bathyarchaeia archaeon]